MNTDYGIYREYPESRIYEAQYIYDTCTIGPYTIELPFGYSRYDIINNPVIPPHEVLQLLYRYKGLAAICSCNTHVAILNKNGIVLVCMEDGFVSVEPSTVDYTERYNQTYCGWEITKPFTKLCTTDIYKVPGKGILPPLSSYKELVNNHKDCTMVISDKQGNITFK